MDEKTKTELALFRFSLIAPLVNGSCEKSQKEYLEEICAKRYDVPGLGYREFSTATVKGWLSLYRRYGLEGLKRKPRNDRGTFRHLSSEAQAFIKESLKASPEQTAIKIHQDLLNSGLSDTPSVSTVSRFIKQLRSTLSEPEVERKRYEFPFANDCWQSDIMVGPYLLIDGKKLKTHLIAFMDDASRLIVHSQFFFTENYLALEETLRQALLKRGIPKKIFVDNGKVYQSLQLRLICARLGITLSFARPYSPSSKGKIERFFRTFRNSFLSQLDISEISSLDELNKLHTSYIEGTYNQRPHSSLNGLSPIERFLQDKEHLRFVEPSRIQRDFLHEVKRRVSKDATVSLNRKIFEVPQIYCSHQVKILYSPYDLSFAYLCPPEGEELIRVYPVRTVENCMIPRKQNLREPIDYTKLYEGE